MSPPPAGPHSPHATNMLSRSSMRRPTAAACAAAAPRAQPPAVVSLAAVRLALVLAVAAALVGRVRGDFGTRSEVQRAPLPPRAAPRTHMSGAGSSPARERARGARASPPAGARRLRHARRAAPARRRPSAPSGAARLAGALIALPRRAPRRGPTAGCQGDFPNLWATWYVADFKNVNATLPLGSCGGWTVPVSTYVTDRGAGPSSDTLTTSLVTSGVKGYRPPMPAKLQAGEEGARVRWGARGGLCFRGVRGAFTPGHMLSCVLLVAGRVLLWRSSWQCKKAPAIVGLPRGAHRHRPRLFPRNEAAGLLALKGFCRLLPRPLLNSCLVSSVYGVANMHAKLTS